MDTDEAAGSMPAQTEDGQNKSSSRVFVTLMFLKGLTRLKDVNREMFWFCCFNDGSQTRLGLRYSLHEPHVVPNFFLLRPPFVDRTVVESYRTHVDTSAGIGPKLPGTVFLKQ